MSESAKQKRMRQEPRKSQVPAIISALVVVAVFVALGFMLASNQPGSTTQTEAFKPGSDGAATPAAAGNPPVATPAPAAAAPANVPDTSGRADKYTAAPPMTIDPAKSYTATITTPRGDIVVKLRPDIAPKTVNSFVFLAREGFYDGLTWHRVLQGFMAQGGDPTGTGMGGPGYNVPAEFTDKIKFDRPGLLAMARAQDPDSAGSQFFITTAPADFLDGQYTIFGEVTAGQEIVDGIPLRDPDQNPSTPGEQMLKIAITEQ